MKMAPFLINGVMVNPEPIDMDDDPWRINPDDLEPEEPEPLQIAARALQDSDVYMSDRSFLRFLRDARPVDWTVKQRFAANFMLKAYTQKLLEAGFEVSTLPPPVKPGQYRSVKTNRNLWLIEYDPDPIIDSFMKSRFPGQQTAGFKDTQRSVWHVYPSVDSAEKILALSSGFNFKLSDSWVESSRDIVSKNDIPLAMSKAIVPRELKDVPGFGLPLYEFQLAGIEYALAHPRCVIGDEPGLGKTRQALAVAHIKDAFPCVVICPALVKHNWAREARAAWPERNISVLDAGQELPDVIPDVVIVNYDILADRSARGKKYAGQLSALKSISPRAVILDEAHKIRNGDAKRTKACEDLASHCKIVLALTGTPFVNRPKDMVSVLKTIGMLEPVFGSRKAYINRYCAPRVAAGKINDKGASNLEELNLKLRRGCYVRRLKAEVLKDLPPKVLSIVPIQLSDSARAEYDFAEQDLISWMEEQEMKLSLLAKGEYELAPGEPMPKLHNLAAAYRAQQLMRIGVLRQLAANLKLAQCIEWADEFMDEGEKIVLFAWHKDIVRKTSDELGVPYITGDVSPIERQRLVDRFQTDESLRSMVMNIEAGGVGITLTAASNVAFIELPWTPAEIDQAIDRCHRIGQQDSVNGWFLIAEDTIDEYIYRVIQNKRGVVTAAADGGESVAGSVQAEVVNWLKKGGSSVGRRRDHVEAGRDIQPETEGLGAIHEYNSEMRSHGELAGVAVGP